jgi:hypothetical protein
MLGEAYAKYNQTIGPQGGVTLKGDALKTEALAERQEAELELKQYIDGSMPIGIVVVG